MNKIFYALLICIPFLGFTSCEEPEPGDNPSGGTEQPPVGPAQDVILPDFEYEITPWNGEKADDSANDIVGTDAGVYYEANTFSNKVVITYNGESATVENSNSNILTHATGAYITIDMVTHSVKDVEIILRGESNDGALKIYGNNKFKLTLQGVNLESKRGAAINNQCKKAMFVHLENGTTNSLSDNETYSNDAYYINPSKEEDRKGCFFSESNIIFSGTGILSVAGKNNHAIVTDDYLVVRPGVTLVVTEAANNGIHVKGNTKSKIGINILGGVIYANVASDAGKAMKCDMGINVQGGRLLLNVSGNGEYDATTKDTSSSACIKTDKDLVISAGNHILKSTGTGGKGINADGTISIKGGSMTITSSGDEYIYSSNITSSPKAVKADGNISITGGKLNIAATANCNGAEGLDCGAELIVSGGESFIYAFDDAIKATSAISVSGGKILAYSNNNDGVDANNTLTITGGLVIGIGADAPESGIDVEASSKFIIQGGTIVSLGGSLQSAPSSQTMTQYSMLCQGLQLESGQMLSVQDNSGKVIMAIQSPRVINAGEFLFSSSNLTKGESYTISTGGSISDSETDWNGWFTGGTISNSNNWGLILISDLITMISIK